MSTNNETYSIKVDGLDKLIKALSVKPPTARVGILGGKVHAPKEGKSGSGHAPTNAEIGAVHEFGSPTRGIPQRSFLREPIASKLGAYMEKSGTTSQAELNAVIATGSVVPWLKKVAALAETIVQDAFESGGFGKWPAWKNPNYMNNSGQLLIDTSQLQHSITSEIKE